jgi:hypothetical protein
MQQNFNKDNIMTENKRTWESSKTIPKLIHAFEQLEAIDKAEGEYKTQLLREFGSKAPLNFLLSLNFNNNVKLDLPEGMPPLKPKELDTVTHPDMMGTLASNIHRLKHCLPGGNLKPSKKEDIFIQVLLACPLKDAEIMCSAKDKALEELYPTINAELVKNIFPAYVSQ